jgi:hypothetical protein
MDMHKEIGLKEGFFLLGGIEIENQNPEPKREAPK